MAFESGSTVSLRADGVVATFGVWFSGHANDPFNIVVTRGRSGVNFRYFSRTHRNPSLVLMRLIRPYGFQRYL
jgi:hypothetical protein